MGPGLLILNLDQFLLINVFLACLLAGGDSYPQPVMPVFLPLGALRISRAPHSGLSWPPPAEDVNDERWWKGQRPSKLHHGQESLGLRVAREQRQ